MRNLSTFTRILVIGCALYANHSASQSAVTYLGIDEWGGRLGDMLLMYVKAKWVAHQHKLPLLIRPFKYWDQLALYDREQHLTQDIEEHCKKKIITCYDGSEIVDPRKFSMDATFYQVHYYYHPAHWGEIQKKYDSQEIAGWKEVLKDKEFMQELKKCIAPRYQMNIPALPQDKLTVAVHIRTGEGYDNPRASRQLYNINELDQTVVRPQGHAVDISFPLKVPPLQYYVDQIVRLSDLCKDVPMYVHIYTDSHDPVVIMNLIEKAVNKNNITFDCRDEGNHHSSNVLEDIFAMAQYQCLIRSGSNYPQVSQLIGNHKIVISPLSAKWIADALVIDEIALFTME